MYYKQFEHYIMLCLIKQITLILNVSARTTDSGGTKMFTDEQLKDLANNVCGDLKFYIKVPKATCIDNFWAPDDSMPKLELKVKTKCQTSGSIKFHIEPSESWQLVALVPHFTNKTKNDITLINYSLVEPNNEFWDIGTIPERNYTIWSTKLKEGAPVMWRGGDRAPRYNPSAEHRKYDIKLAFHPKKAGSGVQGRFTWNSTDGDSCFEVVNFCEKTNLQETQVLPNNEGLEPHVILDLAVEEECYIEVTGKHGTTRLDYLTPPCKSMNGCKEDMKPEYANNITIIATEDGVDSWKVRVNWARPSRLPDFYNVTLRADAIQDVLLPGDATEAVFENVVGEGGYNVSIYSTIGEVTAHTSRLKFFPGGWRGAGGAGGGAALGAGCAAAAALALLYRYRRRAHRAPAPDYKPNTKPSKEETEVLEVLEVWNETEDRWEVRSDRLVLHEVIGEGAFGVVRRASLAPHSTHVAVKMLKDFPSLDEIRSFRSEMELMKSVGVHPHLVSLVGVCSGRRPLIIAEYCSRGDLLSYLRCTWDIMLSKRNAKYYNNNIDVSDYRNDLFKSKTRVNSSNLVVNKLYELQEICDKELTALDLLSFCRQIAMGMEFLAANRVVHRDLAARNILVTANRTLKIADFGLSRDVYEENQYKQKGNGKMPIKWMALESLTRRIYTTQSDVWSFGVVVWEIATVGGAPYASVPAARLPRLLRSGYRMPKPNNCSPQLYDVMLSCWRTHPRDRPTFAELHHRLDELLNNACANQYLSLEVDAEDPPPTPKHHKYIKMFIRGKRGWTRGENYERPLQAPCANHYTTPPDSLAASQ